MLSEGTYSNVTSQIICFKLVKKTFFTFLINTSSIKSFSYIKEVQHLQENDN